MEAYKRKQHPFLLLAVIVLLALSLNLLAGSGFGSFPGFGALRVRKLETVQLPQWVEVDLIEVDGVSRRGQRLEDIQNIVIHYVGNPGTSARANRNWYASAESEVSSHFLVGLDGEVILCVPLHERSSASNHRNRDTISIEVCHPDDSGKFSDTTYDALVRLTAWLVEVCGLDAQDVIRHYDITGKECPRYYVKNEDSWQALLQDVAAAAP